MFSSDNLKVKVSPLKALQTQTFYKVLISLREMEPCILPMTVAIIL